MKIKIMRWLILVELTILLGITFMLYLAGIIYM